MRYTQRVLLTCLLGIGAILFLARCGDDDNGGGGGQGTAKPTLGANEAFQVHGSTDDKDNGNGPATNYRSTTTASSSDQLTTATSTPTTYRDIAVDVHAEPGANPTDLAIAFGNTKATSTFTVAADTTCRLVVQSAATVALDSGLADYLVVARIRSAPATPGQTGPPVQGSDTQAKYEFAQNGATPTTLDIKRWGQADGTMPSGDTIQRADTSGTFMLTPGTYTLEFEITANGTADTSADLKANAQVDLL